MTGKLLRLGAGYLAAVLLTAALGSITQTQFNLVAIVRLGVTVPPMDWLRTTLADLVSFGPMYALVVAAAFLIAFAVAGWSVHRLPGGRALWFAAAGTIGVLVAIVAINSTLDLSAIAATRHLAATAILAAAGGLGGLLFVAVQEKASATR